LHSKRKHLFLPAGHACEVGLHRALDTLHIYLRANLIPVHAVTPLLVERDVVIQHLAQAVEQAVCEMASPDSMANPASFEYFVRFAEQLNLTQRV
jgi:hypothetical protein